MRGEHRRTLVKVESQAVADRDAVTVRIVWEDTWVFPGPEMGKNPSDWSSAMREAIAEAFDPVGPPR